MLVDYAFKSVGRDNLAQSFSRSHTSVHQICPHSQLHTFCYIRSAMQQTLVLEDQYTANLGIDIEFSVHDVHGFKRCGTTFQLTTFNIWGRFIQV